ncbi:hypothetical protein [Botrimarina hoheduenensis]|uniref:Chain length determinant protein n=1 Tax=Botrimarina hoheduenensis TaxID=2528000 RepID=A0A5C5WG48_9BACT|nr:hypothetical protein [Botrimarina hoheduenensis]TWT48752.1 hypothetical protein Pla111_05270 [Botrimarina hoheduenensis]
MPNAPVTLSALDLIDLVQRRRNLLVGPAIAGFVLAAIASLILPRYWHAQQGLLIRSDAAGYADQRLGKFTDLAEMKTVQETLLELARSRSVVEAVLTEVRGKTPTPRAIADFRDRLRFSPPGGAEFGKTEIFYLGVLDTNRDRAIALVESTARELDLRLQALRDQRAGSMVAEVGRSVEVARAQLTQHLESLAKFELSVGADLIELRHLISPTGGQSEFSARTLAIEADLRTLVQRSRENEALLNELELAATDPARLSATPDSLLAGQPGVRRLKSGLVEAQLNVARIAGARTPDHPFVLAARQAEVQVRNELSRELPTAIAGVKLELDVATQREAELRSQLQNLRLRSSELASKRSRYAEISANVDSQTRVLEGALKQLADAKAHRAGAESASLLSAIDTVETGVNPAGPGRTTIAATGGLAGLLLGAAIVFLLEAPVAPGSTPRRPITTQASKPAAGDFGSPVPPARTDVAPPAATVGSTLRSDAENWLASISGTRR